jgi:phospholipid/cholesterol/gamma-HCH transport system substrate-binding protein
MSVPVVVGRALWQRRVAGVVFLVVMLALVQLTVLLYNKAFTDVVKVTLEAGRAGNQLTAPADVKIRGLVVGEVREVESSGRGARIQLALQPDKVKLIPTNVQAQLLPKTLFGEKYVLLVIPKDASGTIGEGDVISQDRSSTALETEKVLDNLLPLLRSLKPEALSMTLNALSEALRGRGDRLGSNFVAAGAYFRQFNPSLPTLARDMEGLADFANNTADATPALLEVLDNFSFSSRALVDVQPDLDTFLTSTTQFAASARSIVAENESRFVALARDSLPSLELYARYSPEFPCFFQGLATYNPIVEKTFGGAQPGLHITVEAIRNQEFFAPGDEPQYKDTRPPYCDKLPKPKMPAGEGFFNDGFREPSQAGQTVTAASYLTPTSGNAALIAVSAPVLGVNTDRVPDLVEMLFGPLAAGHTVGVR